MRKIPLDELGIEDLRIMVGQNLGLPHKEKKPLPTGLLETYTLRYELLFSNDILRRHRGWHLRGRLIDLPAFDNRMSGRICGDDDEGLLIRKR